MVLYGENTQYRIKLKKLIARARAQWPLGTGVWATAGLGRALSAVSHTHTPARPGRPRRPPRGVSASAVPRAASGLPGAVLSPPRPSPMHPPRVRPIMRCRARLRTPTRRTHAHAWSMEGRGEAGHQAGGPDADDGTYERTEIDRSEREATPDATRTGASGHSSCAHRPPQSARERAGLSRLHRRESSSTELSGECAISLRRERYPIYCTQEDIYTIYHTLYTLAQQMQF